MLGYAARRVDRIDDAADIVAEVFTVVWRRIDQVPDCPDARPWMFGVARNVIANHRRGARRQDRLSDRLRHELETRSTSRPALSEMMLDLRRALGRLDDEARELLLLTCWEELSPREIALAMGIPAGTVRSRLHRARLQLRRELEVGVGPGLMIDLERRASPGQVQPSERRPLRKSRSSNER